MVRITPLLSTRRIAISYVPRPVGVIKRTIEISREPTHLALSNEQLLLKRDGVIVGQAPCEDLGVVVVDHPQTTYTHAALAKLAECGAAVVLCGANHLPTAMILPLADHSQVVWRLRDQLAVGRPLAKQLWKQLVVAKIRGQARNLHPTLPAYRKLLALAAEVRSGDPTNIEAQAARVYWQNWLWSEDPGELDVEGFRRDADAPGVNSFLNYGYAIVRAGLGRAIVSAGLLPSLGLHHRNRSNAFCLADDLIEPYRPIVDERVRAMRRQGYDELTQPAKKELLDLLTLPMRLGDQTGPMMVMMHRTVASLARCFSGEAKRLDIPVPADGPMLDAERSGATTMGMNEKGGAESDRSDSAKGDAGSLAGRRRLAVNATRKTSRTGASRRPARGAAAAAENSPEAEHAKRGPAMPQFDQSIPKGDPPCKSLDID